MGGDVVSKKSWFAKKNQKPDKKNSPTPYVVSHIATPSMDSVHSSPSKPGNFTSLFLSKANERRERMGAADRKAGNSLGSGRSMGQSEGEGEGEGEGGGQGHGQGQRWGEEGGGKGGIGERGRGGGMGGETGGGGKGWGEEGGRVGDSFAGEGGRGAGTGKGDGKGEVEVDSDSDEELVEVGEDQQYVNGKKGVEKRDGEEGGVGRDEEEKEAEVQEWESERERERAREREGRNWSEAVASMYTEGKREPQRDRRGSGSEEEKEEEETLDRSLEESQRSGDSRRVGGNPAPITREFARVAMGGSMPSFLDSVRESSSARGTSRSSLEADVERDREKNAVREHKKVEKPPDVDFPDRFRANNDSLTLDKKPVGVVTERFDKVGKGASMPKFPLVNSAAQKKHHENVKKSSATRMGGNTNKDNGTDGSFTAQFTDGLSVPSFPDPRQKPKKSSFSRCFGSS